MLSMANKFNNKDWVLKELNVLSILLDSKFRLPGGFKFGWDAILSIVPGVGPLIATVISMYIVVRAMMLKSSYYLLAHMILNIFFDLAISLVPVIGFIFDVFFKSNIKNVKLLENSLLEPEVAIKSSRNHLFGILFMVLASFIIILYILFLILSEIFGLIINNI
jgi:hypothetical protein